jgi:hypothetical protein
MPSDQVLVSAIGAFGVIAAPSLVVVITHLLKQRATERGAARRAVTSQRGGRVYWRARAMRLSRQHRADAKTIRRLRRELERCRSLDR